MVAACSLFNLRLISYFCSYGSSAVVIFLLLFFFLLMLSFLILLLLELFLYLDYILVFYFFPLILVLNNEVFIFNTFLNVLVIIREKCSSSIILF
jgi:hypothetical protein